MPGGYGGKDIYYVTYTKRSKSWGDPINLGPVINSAGDEMFPFKLELPLYQERKSKNSTVYKWRCKCKSLKVKSPNKEYPNSAKKNTSHKYLILSN